MEGGDDLVQKGVTSMVPKDVLLGMLAVTAVCVGILKRLGNVSLPSADEEEEDDKRGLPAGH